MTYDFAKKRIAVIGMARSGMAAAEVLSRRGATVTVYDGKHETQLLSALNRAADLGIFAVAGASFIGPADIAIASPGVRIDSPILNSARSQDIPIWGEIEAAYRLSKAPILAVTGTNGKTTTALLAAEMLRAGGITAYAAGNIAAGSLAMPLIIAADVATSGDAIVAEISSFQLETIDTFRPKIAAILNITADHQDRQSWESYIASKWRLTENQGSGDTAVLHSELPRPLTPVHLPSDVQFFDQLESPEWLSRIILPGSHNRLNALAAAVMARAFGIAEDAIACGATTFPGVVHRLEFIDRIDGVAYINNSMCTNNAAFASSLQAIAGPKVVIAGGVFKGGDTSPLASASADNDVRLLVLFGRSATEIDGVVRSLTSVQTVVVETLDAAVAVATANARYGETVILNPGCTSLDQFKDFEDRGDAFKALVIKLRKDVAQ